MESWRRIDEVEGRVIVTHIRWELGAAYVEVTDHNKGPIAGPRQLSAEIARRLTTDRDYGFRQAG